MRLTPVFSRASTRYSDAVLLTILLLGGYRLLATEGLRGRESTETLSAKRGAERFAATAGMWLGLFAGVILQDLQIGDRVGKRVAETGFHAGGRQGVELFAVRLGKVQFGLPDPGLRNREIIGDRHRQFVDRRLVLISGGKSRKISQQDRRPAEQRQPVLDGPAQGDAGFGQTLAVRRKTCAKSAAGHDWRRRETRRGERKRLEKAPQFLREGLR